MIKIGINWYLRDKGICARDRVDILKDAGVYSIDFYTRSIINYPQVETLLKDLAKANIKVTLHGQQTLSVINDSNKEQLLLKELSHLKEVRKKLNSTGHNYVTTVVCHRNNYSYLIHEEIDKIYKRFNFILLSETLTQKHDENENTDRSWEELEMNNRPICWDIGHTFENYRDHNIQRLPNENILHQVKYTHIHSNNHREYNGELYPELEALIRSGYYKEGIFSLEYDTNEVIFFEAVKSIYLLRYQLEKLLYENIIYPQQKDYLKEGTNP